LCSGEETMTPLDCLKKAEYCEELAELTLKELDRDSLRTLAREWRAMAKNDAYYKLCDWSGL
jgi:hypothetical protein